MLYNRCYVSIPNHLGLYYNSVCACARVCVHACVRACVRVDYPEPLHLPLQFVLSEQSLTLLSGDSICVVVSDVVSGIEGEVVVFPLRSLMVGNNIHSALLHMSSVGSLME